MVHYMQLEKNKSILEVSCLIYGIVSAAMAVASSVIFIMSITSDPPLEFNSSNICISSLIGVFIVGWFIMSILLCVGIYKRKAGFVRGYFVFITVSEIIILPCTAVVTFAISIGWAGYLLPGAIAVLVCCGIHALALILVHKTMTKIKNKQSEIDEMMIQNLVEKY